MLCDRGSLPDPVLAMALALSCSMVVAFAPCASIVGAPNLIHPRPLAPSLNAVVMAENERSFSIPFLSGKKEQESEDDKMVRRRSLLRSLRSCM